MSVRVRHAKKQLWLAVDHNASQATIDQALTRIERAEFLDDNPPPRPKTLGELATQIAEAERLGKWDEVVSLQKEMTARLNKVGAL